MVISDFSNRAKYVGSNGKFQNHIFAEYFGLEKHSTVSLSGRLNYCISQSFKKIRIKRSVKNVELENLFNKRRIFKGKKDEASVEMLKQVELKLAEICADDNLKLIEEACEGLTCEE